MAENIHFTHHLQLELSKILLELFYKLDSYFHIEYCGSFAAANNTIWEHHNSKIKVKNKVEYLEPQPLGPTGPVGHIGPVGSYVNHNIEVK